MISTHPKMLHETLASINNAPDVTQALIDSFKLPYVREYIELLVSNNFVEFDPNDIVTKEYNYHLSMAGAYLINRQTWNIVSNVIMSDNAKLETKTIQFKALSEMLFAEEAIILKLILLKDLSSKYPNITFEIMFEATSCPPTITV